jgi:hypothetical protein
LLISNMRNVLCHDSGCRSRHESNIEGTSPAASLLTKIEQHVAILQRDILSIDGIESVRLARDHQLQADHEGRPGMVQRSIAFAAAVLGMTLALSACTDPYDPGQRALGGGLLGAGTGAAIGGLAGGGRGAAAGALIGGGIGAVGGAVTTPRPPPPAYYAPPPPPPPGYYPPPPPPYRAY